jgi:glycerol-3-phosphate acyltransferase PlsY
MSLWVILCIVGAYLAGSIPTGYLVVKKLKGIDIRTIGSGGTGATNVRRAAGNKAALVVMGLDILKGLIPVLLVRWAFPTGTPDEPMLAIAGQSLGSAWAWLHVAVAFMSVLGHSKSIFLNFAGGKSAATGLGGVIGLAWLPAVIIGVVAFVVTKVSRYQSVGSLTACFLAPILLYVFKAPMPYVIYGAVASLFVVYMHKGNIQRLMAGTENRL